MADDRPEMKRLLTRDAYLNPTLDCDMVMKGGITSGVVYPLAVCELATKYKFHSVGGSSAGAIAAALCAAAELGRASADGGFHRLASLPAYLAGNDYLLKLFQPSQKTRPLFNLLVFFLKHRASGQNPGFLGWTLAALREIWRAPGGKAWFLSRLLLLMGIASGGAYLVSTMGSAVVALLTLLALLVVVVLFLRGAVQSLWKKATSILETGTGFGLCTGARTGSAPAKPIERDPFKRKYPGPNWALTDWLDEELNALAGHPGGEPLSFGHLLARNAKCPTEPTDYDPLKRIRLEMFTTNLTHGRPHRLPLSFNTSFHTDAFFFDPEVFLNHFPEHVVKWMLGHPPSKGKGVEERDWDDWQLLCQLLDRGHGLKPLPAIECLPVVVATRMSLSFPLLISAVPLWAIDWSTEQNQALRQEWRHLMRSRPDTGGSLEDLLESNPNLAAPVPSLCWFSDGGICSNFPIHFFDRPLPRWPTFGINLRSPFSGRGISKMNQGDNVWMAKDSADGHQYRWAPVERLRDFLLSILDTMYNWNDNAQMRVHGYWDRVAHVFLDESKEGGLNMTMTGSLIDDLSARGWHAGRRLAERFDPDEQNERPSWDSHRWQRYRTLMSLLENLLEGIERGYGGPRQGTSRSYADLINRDNDSPPDAGYWWERNDQRDLARNRTNHFLDLIADWQKSGESFEEGAPRPQPLLRTMPPI